MVLFVSEDLPSTLTFVGQFRSNPGPYPSVKVFAGFEANSFQRVPRNATQLGTHITLSFVS